MSTKYNRIFLNETLFRYLDLSDGNCENVNFITRAAVSYPPVVTILSQRVTQSYTVNIDVGL